MLLLIHVVNVGTVTGFGLLFSNGWQVNCHMRLADSVELLHLLLIISAVDDLVNGQNM